MGDEDGFADAGVVRVRDQPSCAMRSGFLVTLRALDRRLVEEELCVLFIGRLVPVLAGQPSLAG